MQIVLGPFHPHLEDALVEAILRCKENRPLAPILILVPSDSLRRRIKVLLARERGRDFLNLYVLTFYQLSLRLLEESDGPGAMPLQDDALLEEILRQIVRGRPASAAAFAGLDEKAGGSAALWQTLRDLKDGAVDPAVVLEAARAGLFEESTAAVERLFTLFETFLSGSAAWGLRDYADLDRAAVERVGESEFLTRFERVFYYGFYDLTQVQLDIFAAVARRAPTTLFFPLVHGAPKNPAWSFAERFYERYARGLAGAAPRDLVEPDGAAAHPSPLPLFTDEAPKRREAAPGGFSAAVYSCFSAREEIETVAKEILRLVSDEKFSFSDIGVVGRALETHRPWLKEIFSKHAVPFAASAEEPLVQHPLAKAALLLVNLPLKDYVRSHVTDLVDSPFFKIPRRERRRARPDLWDLATRRLGVAKGWEDWRRLEKYIARDIVVAEAGEEDDAPRKISIPAAQTRALWNIFSALRMDLETLPKEAAWSRYVGLWQALQAKWLDLEAAEYRATAGAIADALARLAALDATGAQVAREHFLETYQRALERATAPFTDRNTDSVAVLDAMAARGVRFRALFIVGLNEGIFPRTIREDAFLRDRDRELLETVLGYKVATKLGAFDEEKLLFTLLADAAKERLYCLHARNDGQGRPLAPSWYLDELRRALGETIKTFVVPRGAVEKSALSPFDKPEQLPPEEMAVRMILTAADPAPLLRRSLPAPSLYARGGEVIRRLETIASPLGEHDGVVGPLPEFWRRAADEGLAPTALEGYARCPFQFFARNLLGLERLERPEESAGPGAADLGTIVHAILGAFYQELLERKFFPAQKTPNPAAILRAASEKVFRDFERDHPVGYPLQWEIVKESVGALLEQVIARDLQELADSGFAPHALERDAAVRLPESWPAPLNAIMVRGRMDRIDYHEKENRYRVVDYKLKSGKTRRAEDNDLLRSALRGARLQLPFYLLLGETGDGLFDRSAPDDAAFYFLAPAWSDGPLVVERIASGVWSGAAGARLKATVAFLAESMRRGLFFIQPHESYCRYCAVSEACRKNHRPTLWRGERDPRVKAHLDLRTKDAEE